MSDSSRKPASKFKSLRSLMQNRDQGFGQLLAHARELDSLDTTLASILDPALMVHCQVAEFRNHHLILVCSNATFAARIRMISQHLRDTLNEDGRFQVDLIKVQIAPVNRPQPEVRKQRTLSPTAIQALGRFAEDSGDADIQAIFNRIKARRNRQ